MKVTYTKKIIIVSHTAHETFNAIATHLSHILNKKLSYSVIFADKNDIQPILPNTKYSITIIISEV